MRAFIAQIKEPDEKAKLRKRAINSSESLRQSERARWGPIEEMLTDAFAVDLGAEAGDIRPPIVAASVRAAMATARDRIEAEGGKSISHEQALKAFDEVLEFLRGGLEALRRAPDAG